MSKVKTALLASLLVASAAVSADDKVASTGDFWSTQYGALSGAGWTAVGVGLLTVTSIVSNSDDDSVIVPPPPPPLKCQGNDPMVNGVCIGSRDEVVVKEIVTATGTGTGTATATATSTATAIQVVTYTYAPS